MKISKSLQSPFQLVATQILEYKIENSFLTIPDDVEISTECEYDTKLLDGAPEDNVLSGLVFLEVKVIVNSSDNNTLKATLKMAGGFGQKGDDKEAFTKMLEINGCASLYSYARSYLSQNIALATSTGGKQIIIPLINVFKLKEKKDKKSANKQ